MKHREKEIKKRLLDYLNMNDLTYDCPYSTLQDEDITIQEINYFIEKYEIDATWLLSGRNDFDKRKITSEIELLKNEITKTRDKLKVAEYIIELQKRVIAIEEVKTRNNIEKPS